jgi:glycosyltransferase involved in cell wall biosynthesis
VAAQRIVSIQTTSERGGAEYANVDVLEALRRRGHDVRLVTNLPDLADGTGVRVRAVELGPKLSRRNAWRVVLEAPRALWRLARVLSDARPVDVTLVHFKKEQLLIALLPQRLTGRIVWAEWGPVPPALRHGIPRLVYALAGRRAAAVMAVSEGTKGTVVDAGVTAAKVTVVPNLVEVHDVKFDTDARVDLRRRWGASDATFVVGCISRFQQRKRNDVVIDALADLEGDVLLVMAGEGDQEAELRRRAAPYGDRVRFEPNVRGHVEAFISACDVLVFAPSPTEGEPRVIVMSQLVGVPVIATDPEGALGLIQPGAGAIVSPSHDAPALAATLAAYRDDPGRRTREGGAARAATLESHDPERTLRAIERSLGVGSD